MPRVCVPLVNKTRCGATGTPAATVRTTDAAPLRRLGSLPFVHLTSFQHLALPATRGALAALAAWAAWAAGLADPAPAPGPAPPPVLRSESGRYGTHAHPHTTQRVRRLNCWPSRCTHAIRSTHASTQMNVNSVKLPPNTRTERVAHRVAQGEQLREWDNGGVPRSETTQLPLPRTGLHHNRLPLDCAVKVAQQQRPWRALLSSWASCVCT